MAEVTDIVERVARELHSQLGGGSGDYNDAARAAIAEMVKALGEPDTAHAKWRKSIFADDYFNKPMEVAFHAGYLAALAALKEVV